MSETLTQTRTAAMRFAVRSQSNSRLTKDTRSASLQKILCSNHLPFLPALILWMRSSRRSLHQVAETWKATARLLLVYCALHVAQGLPLGALYKVYACRVDPFLRRAGFVLAVYASATYVSVQLLGCFLLLITVSCPLGLAFMLVSLSLISAVMTNVFIGNTDDVCPGAKCPRCGPIRTELTSSADEGGGSRPRTRRHLSIFGDKTFSKIKLW